MRINFNFSTTATIETQSNILKNHIAKQLERSTLIFYKENFI